MQRKQFFGGFSDGQPESSTCTPGSSFLTECNTCVCDSTGKSISCTEKDCLRQGEFKNLVKRDSDGDTEEAEECSSGDTKMKVCFVDSLKTTVNL